MDYLFSNSNFLLSNNYFLFLNIILIFIFSVIFFIKKDNSRAQKIIYLIAYTMHGLSLAISIFFLYLIIQFWLLDYEILVKTLSFITLTFIWFVFGTSGYLFRTPKKKILLFLRKFTVEELNNCIHSTVTKNISQLNYRLLALDDSKIKSTSGSKLQIITSLFVVLLIIVLITVGYIFYSIFGNIDIDIFSVGSEESDVELTYGFFSLLLMFFLSISWIPFFFYQAFSFISSIAAKNAFIDSEKSLEKLKVSIEHSKRRINSRLIATPPSQVVKTSDIFWKTSVRNLIPLSHTVLIDISEYTDSIKWECDTLAESANHNIIVTRKLNEGQPEFDITELTTQMNTRGRNLITIEYSNFVELRLKLTKTLLATKHQ